jgi:hypothetical protein
MAAILKKPYRIRCVSGELAGLWLWTIAVSKNRLPFDVMDWGDLLLHPDRFNFHPQFVPEVIAALSAPRELAEGYVRLLAREGFDCEIVSD